MAGRALPSISQEELSQHGTPENAWVAIRGIVYDVSKFAKLHPGGRRILLEYAGKDATEAFATYHPETVLPRYANLQVGTLSSAPEAGGADGALRQPRRRRSEESEESRFGDQVPFGDPLWYQGFPVPYYRDSHKTYRALIRRFVESELKPNAQKWDEAGTYPEDLPRRAYQAGVLGATYPKEFGGTRPDDFDSFHDLIFWDELARAGCGGVLAAVFVSMAIALPPIFSVGSDYIKNKVCRSVITGEKVIALAITEPYVGSDVAGIQTTATRDGDDYVLNGEKKFITSGCRADYIVVAARTGGKGMMGISLLLVEKDTPGFTSRRLRTQGWWSSNTAYLTFENCRVPAKNLIGEENMGFMPIMLQFNHERFIGMVSSVRAARMCVEEAIKYARVRKTFGQRLIDHQVIRHKIAEMVMRVETTQAAVELFAHQMEQGLGPRKLGALAALHKVAATRALEFCAREASQIFGGASYVRGGVGEKIERIYREVRVNAIGGGSEEVMLDFSMRMSKL